MLIEIDQERFFAELTVDKTVVGVSNDDQSEPVLTVVSERTDDCISVPVTTELLEGLKSVIHLHNQWERNKGSSSDAYATGVMRPRHRNNEPGSYVGPRLRLIQLGTDEHVFVFDVRRIGADIKFCPRSLAIQKLRRSVRTLHLNGSGVNSMECL